MINSRFVADRHLRNPGQSFIVFDKALTRHYDSFSRERG